MNQRFIYRQGVRLAYEQRGHGPLVVLVPGLGMPGRLWLRLPAGLMKSGFTVITPDNRGVGRSASPLPPYTMRELAADLAAVIREAGGGPALVAGLSLGGMVAQHLALDYPELVRGLVLAATSCGLPHGTLPNLRFLPLLVAALRGKAPAAAELRAMLVHPASLQRNPQLFEAWDREAQQTPLSWPGLLGQLSAAALHSTGFRLSCICCPTIVIAGEDDRIIPAENARVLARRLPNAELVLLPQAGHAFPLEQPRAIPEAIGRLRQSTTASP